MAKVLIIDDERSIRFSFKSMLSKQGHDVDTAENWEEARIFIQKYDYDVVFLDILMPKISGLRILKAIKDAIPDCLVIMMTGEPTIESSQKALRYGAADYLTKPVSRDTLQQICTRAVERKTLITEQRKLEKSNRESQKKLEEAITQLTLSDDCKVNDEDYLDMARKLVNHQKQINRNMTSVRSKLIDAVKSIQRRGEDQ